MSGDLLTDPEIERLTVKKPAARWFNWWRAIKQLRCVFCGVLIESGVAYSNVCAHCGDGPFASRDIAETRANQIASWARFEGSEFIGALPEGETP